MHTQSLHQCRYLELTRLPFLSCLRVRGFWLFAQIIKKDRGQTEEQCKLARKITVPPLKAVDYCRSFQLLKPVLFLSKY